jgi:hypothetical protein
MSEVVHVQTPDEISTDAGWEPLTGGTLSSVERRGDVVRRKLVPASPAVHALLTHIEAAGFDEAPRFLGTDGDWELLSFVPGTIPSQLELRSGCVATDDVMTAAARVLRRFHDATRGLDPAGLPWAATFLQSGNHDVICHNDFGPWNCTFTDGMPTGMIDFSEAAPGSREWDLVFSATFFVPLHAWADFSDAPRRLRLMCDAYGLDDRSRVVPTLIERSERTIRVAEELIAAGGAEEALGRDIHPFAVRSLEVLGGHVEALQRAME